MRPFILLLAALTLVGCSDATGPAAPGGSTSPVTTSPVTTSPVTTTPVTTTPVTTSPVGGGAPSGGVSATVVHVYDGDSMRVAFDGRPDEVRLEGINAPEGDECWGDPSRDLLVSLAGDTVTVVGDERDQYGRLIAYVFGEGVDLNEEMLRSGGALAESVDHPLLDEFLTAEAAAYAGGKGMWAGDACGPATGAAVAIAGVTARGDESVALTNPGPPVDLTGWLLRDESSVHRFAFPSGFVLAAGGSVTIHTDCGTDTPADLHWCADGPVWNNAGDTALLLDPDGNVVARLRYP